MRFSPSSKVKSCLNIVPFFGLSENPLYISPHFFISVKKIFKLIYSRKSELSKVHVAQQKQNIFATDKLLVFIDLTVVWPVEEIRKSFKTVVLPLRRSSHFESEILFWVKNHFKFSNFFEPIIVTRELSFKVPITSLLSSF